MTYFLIKALEKLLKDGFAQMRFRHTEADPGKYISPQFFIGAVPARRPQNDPALVGESEFPFIINRFHGGTDSEDTSQVQIKTLFGIYTAQDIEAGEHDIVNMLMRARRIILEQQMLDDVFELELPMKWSLGESDEENRQPHPYYGGQITTTWKIPVIERNIPLDQEEKVYGHQRD